MKTELKEYTEAFQAHLSAQENVVKAELAVKISRAQLATAREQLLAKEKEVLDDVERQITQKDYEL